MIKILRQFFLVLLILGWTTKLWANFDLAEKSFENGIYNFAIVNYLKTLENENDFFKKEKAFARLVESYFFIGQYQNAFKYIDDYLKKFPDGNWVFNVRYIQSQIYFKSNGLEKSKEILKKMINDFPKHPNSYRLLFSLVEIYQQENNYEQAIQLLERPMEGLENDLNYFKASIHYQNKNYQTAWGEILKVDKEKLTLFTFDQATDLHVEILLKIESYQEVLKVIERNYYRLQSQDYRDKFSFYQAHIAFLQKNYIKAIVRYKEYLDKFNTSKFYNDAIFFLALAYFNNEQPIIALEQLTILDTKEVNNFLSQGDRARRDKLFYLIYQRLDRQDKQLIFLERLLVRDSPEELFAVQERIKWIAEKEGFTKSVPGSSSRDIKTRMETLLQRYQELEPDSNERSVFYNDLANIYFKNNNTEMNVFFSRRAYSNSFNDLYGKP